MGKYSISLYVLIPAIAWLLTEHIGRSREDSLFVVDSPFARAIVARVSAIVILISQFPLVSCSPELEDILRSVQEDLAAKGSSPQVAALNAETGLNQPMKHRQDSPMKV